MERTWALANFLREQMQQRGWSQKDLAAAAGVPAPTISRLLNRKDVDPELPTLTKIAIALEQPLWKLIAAAGYPIERPASSEDQLYRVQHLSETFPWLVPVMEEFAGLAPDDRESILTYLEVLKQRRQREG